MLVLPIVWQRLVTKGSTCPRCRGTGDEVQQAVGRLKRTLEPLGVTPTLEVRELDEAAFLDQPSHSNRIWIGGEPLEYWIDGSEGSSRCCEECGEHDCRTIEADGKTYEVIPAELVTRAGLIAATRMREAAASTQS